MHMPFLTDGQLEDAERIGTALHPVGGFHYAITDVCFIDSVTGWATTDQGTIIRTCDGGRTWSRTYVCTNHALRSIHFVSRLAGWAVGSRRAEGTNTPGPYGSVSFVVPAEEGIILSTLDGGASWSKMRAADAPWGLNHIFFADDLHGLAVGDCGVMRATHDGGHTWEDMDRLPRCDFTSCCMLSSRIALVTTAGIDPILSSDDDTVEPSADPIEGGIILRTDDAGATWRTVLTVEGDVLSRIHFLDGTMGWAVGGKGALFATVDGGKTWERRNSHTRDDLRAIAFSDHGRGWVVGESGVVLVTTDGGTSWLREYVFGAGDLFGVSACGERTAIGVGEQGVFALSDSPRSPVSPRTSFTEPPTPDESDAGCDITVGERLWAHFVVHSHWLAPDPSEFDLRSATEGYLRSCAEEAEALIGTGVRDAMEWLAGLDWATNPWARDDVLRAALHHSRARGAQDVDKSDVGYALFSACGLIRPTDGCAVQGGVNIRQFEWRDLVGIRGLFASSSLGEEMPRLPYPFINWGSRLEAVRPDDETHQRQPFGFVAERDGTVVGYVACEPITGQARRESLRVTVGVAKDERRRGTARALVEHALEVSETWLAVTRLECLVFAHATPARSFFECLGFEVEGVLRGYAYQGESLRDVCVMSKMAVDRGIIEEGGRHEADN